LGLMVLLLWHAPRLIRAQMSPMQVLKIPRFFQAVPLFLFCIVLSLDFLYETVRLIQGDKSTYTVQE
jgi:TRAP-type C4-dicarboxylate transport system permease small subunit